MAICTYNRADTLSVCLASIAKLTADKSLYEIIVVNNNSTDHTVAVCQAFQEANPGIAFRHVVEPSVGMNFVRNKALYESKYEILTFIDDDATVAPDYVEAVLKTFEDYPDYMEAGGKIVPVYEDGIEPKWLSRFCNPFVKVDLGEEPKPFPSKVGLKYTAIKFPAGCNMMFRKEVFKRVGDFDDVNRGDDAYINNKLRKHGEKILYAPSVLVYHHMSKERSNYESVMKMGYFSGKSLAIWLKAKESRQKCFNILIDRLLKFGFSLLAGAFYCATFRPQKGYYLISYTWNMTKGYIRHF